MDSDDFSYDYPWAMILEHHELAGKNFTPAFDLRVGTERLKHDTGIAPEFLRLSLVVRDPSQWHSECLESWSLTSHPATYAVDAETITRLSGARGLQFELQVTAAESVSDKHGRAVRPGQVVAEKAFDVKVPSEGVDFPVQVVPSSFFEERDLPADTVWVVDWHQKTDFDRPPEEVLQVLVNEDSGEKLLRLSTHDSVAAILWREIAVEILVEISFTIFTSEPSPPQNADGLMGKIYERLRNATGREFDDLVAVSKDDYIGMRFLRAQLQSGMEIGKKAKQINLAGRTS